MAASIPYCSNSTHICSHVSSSVFVVTMECLNGNIVSNDVFTVDMSSPGLLCMSLQGSA